MVESTVPNFRGEVKKVTVAKLRLNLSFNYPERMNGISDIAISRGMLITEYRLMTDFPSMV